MQETSAEPVRRVALAMEMGWPYKRHHEVFAGSHRYLRERGWKSVMDECPWIELERYPSRPVYDGIIGRITPQIAKAAWVAGIPVVNVWQNSPVTEVPLVSPDTRECGRLAAEHLLSRGFEHFAFLGRLNEISSDDAFEGFRESVEKLGYATSNLSIENRHTEDWMKTMEQLELWAGRWSVPTGVFTVYDLFSRYVARACEIVGKNVPQRVAIIGMGDEPVICKSFDLSLTSIDLNYELVGYHAAELLGKLMDGEPAPTEPIRLPPRHLAARQSTDCIAVDDELVADALRFISEHSHERIQVGDVADALEAPRRSLERRFRESLGRTIGREITSVRVDRAKRRLIETTASIKSIADDCGFTDGLQMAVVFKRVEGISPKVYRRTHKEQKTDTES
ncbi:MAG: substrate-binding domain-containing protein [bacterium]|nr:substrate-binding domain-containing protein [bacterium]